MSGRLYAHSLNLEGKVVNEFDTRERLYYSDKDLAELVELCENNHREYPYLTQEILASWATPAESSMLYQWKRQTHPQENYYLSLPYEEGPYAQSDLFMDWLRERSEVGGDPGHFDPEAYLAEVKAQEENPYAATPF